MQNYEADTSDTTRILTYRHHTCQTPK